MRRGGFNKIKKYLIIAIVFLMGSYLGNKLEKNRIMELNSTQSSRVAIVNQDLGVSYKDKEINYAKEIINSLNMDFVITNREIAKKGMNEGEYGATIIFPGNFSKNVTTINDKKPSKVEVYKEINAQLTDGNKVKVIDKVDKFEKEINSKLSYIFVKSLLKEFKTSQDSVEKVLKNNALDEEELNKINNENILATVNLTQQEKKNLVTYPLNVSESFAENKKIIEDMDTRYKEYLSKTEESFNSIRAKYEEIVKEEEYQGIDSLKQEILRLDVIPKDIKYEYNKDTFKEVENFSTEVLEENKEELYKIFKDTDEKLKVTLEEKSRYGYINTNEAKEYIKLILEDEKKEIDKTLNNTNKKLKDKDVQAINKTREIVESIVSTKWRNTIINNQNKYKEGLSANFEEWFLRLRDVKKGLQIYKPTAIVEDNQKTFIDFLYNYDKNQAYIENEIDVKEKKDMQQVEIIYKNSEENVEKMRSDLTRTIKDSEEMLKNGLKNAKINKTKTSEDNKNHLESFSQKMPNIKIGTVENTNLYDFISSPTLVIDASISEKSNAVKKDIPKITVQNYIEKYSFEIGGLVSLTIVIILVYFFMSRKEKELVEN